MPKEMSTAAMKTAIRTGRPAPGFQPGSDAMFPHTPKGSYNGPSNEANAFLKVMLNREVASRPTAQEALNHPFLTRTLTPDDIANLPSLRDMFKRSARCGAFELSTPPRPSSTASHSAGLMEPNKKECSSLY
jgi:serine/threonine protein kinase